MNLYPQHIIIFWSFGDQWNSPLWGILALNQQSVGKHYWGAASHAYADWSGLLPQTSCQWTVLQNQEFFIPVPQHYAFRLWGHKYSMPIRVVGSGLNLLKEQFCRTSIQNWFLGNAYLEFFLLLLRIWEWRPIVYSSWGLSGISKKKIEGHFQIDLKVFPRHQDSYCCTSPGLLFDPVVLGREVTVESWSWRAVNSLPSFVSCLWCRPKGCGSPWGLWKWF